MRNKIPQKTIKKRIKDLSLIQEKISSKRLERLVHKEIICLNDNITQESDGDNLLVLRSEYDAPEIDGNVLVCIRDLSDESVLSQDFIKVKVLEISGSHDLKGEIVF